MASSNQAKRWMSGLWLETNPFTIAFLEVILVLSLTTDQHMRRLKSELWVCPVERLSSEKRNTGCDGRGKSGLPQGPRPNAHKPLIIKSNIWSMVMTFGVGFATPSLLEPVSLVCVGTSPLERCCGSRPRPSQSRILNF